LPSHPRAGTYFAISDTYATANFARCTLESNTLTEAAIGTANTDFNTCRLGSSVNQTSSCTVDRTTTMLAAHARIGAVGTSCNAGAYPLAPSSARPEPSSARFNIGAEAAYTAAADIFDTATFTRCNAVALDASVAAGEEIGGSLLAAVYPGICAARTACIVAGDPPAPALPRAHPSESPTCVSLHECQCAMVALRSFDLPSCMMWLVVFPCHSEPLTEYRFLFQPIY
jgi:hypothetical protein